ncbi:MAG: disulfide oxidoreductase [Chloroflexota bacterium]|nr:disulfide oxidoreductase [Chloroflexota bacterium]
MSVVMVSTFLAVLALVAFGAVLVTALLALPARMRLSPGALDAARAAIGPGALWLAALVATVATAGSLYFSEVAHYVPCALCWYQRIAMYPLVVVLGIAAVRGDVDVRRYAGPMAAIGAVISLYHIGVERLPGLPTGSCSLEAPCDLIWVERFGFVTIPVMALAGFLGILTLLFVYAGRGTDLTTETTT